MQEELRELDIGSIRFDEEIVPELSGIGSIGQTQLEEGFAISTQISNQAEVRVFMEGRGVRALSPIGKQMRRSRMFRYLLMGCIKMRTGD